MNVIRFKDHRGEDHMVSHADVIKRFQLKGLRYKSGEDTLTKVMESFKVNKDVQIFHSEDSEVPIDTVRAGDHLIIELSGLYSMTDEEMTQEYIRDVPRRLSVNRSGGIICLDPDSN